MSDALRDGGPAFPSGAMNIGDGDMQAYAPGMALRDWFAGQVLASASALPLGPEDSAFRARVAYEQADAMIAARGQ